MQHSTRRNKKVTLLVLAFALLGLMALMPASALAQNPSTGSVVINGGDFATNNTDVTLTITNPTGVSGTLYYQVYSVRTAAPLTVTRGPRLAARSPITFPMPLASGTCRSPWPPPTVSRRCMCASMTPDHQAPDTMDTWSRRFRTASTWSPSLRSRRLPVRITSLLAAPTLRSWPQMSLASSSRWPPRAGIPPRPLPTVPTAYVQYTEYSLDGGLWTDAARWPMAWPVGANLAEAQSFVEFSDLADGAHTLLYRSVDHWNNVEVANELDFIVDTTAPSTSTYATLSSGATADLSKWYSRDVTVHFQAQ